MIKEAANLGQDRSAFRVTLIVSENQVLFAVEETGNAANIKKQMVVYMTAVSWRLQTTLHP